MKVAIYNRSLDYGGVSNVCTKLHRGLNKQGISTQLLCFVNERGIKGANILIAKGLFNESKKLSEYLIKNKIDVILLSPCIHIIGIKIFSLIKKKKIKVITTVHMRPKFWLLNKTFNNKITNFLTRCSLKVSDQVISVSNDLSKELVSLNLINPKKIVTIYNPIIEREVSQHPLVNIEEKEVIELVMVGWIYELKGQHIAIEALNRLNSSRYRLNIIGGIKDEQYYKHLLKLIKDYNLTNQVRFMGVLDNVKEYLQMMDIYILASHSEALPTVLIEALECGIPIIASNCKWGPEEILENGEYGYLYNVNNHNQLVELIMNLTCNNQNYNKFRLISHKRANCFKEEEIIQSYVNLIKGDLK